MEQDRSNEYEEMMKNTNFPFGIHIVQPHENVLKEKVKKGYLFIGYGTDALFLINASKLPKGLS